MYSFPIRVYYEDTDLAGIVYYANYLRFIERARTELLRAAGIDQSAMKDATGVVFAVRRLSAEYLAPARLDDLLEVETAPVTVRGARVVFDQRVLRARTPLFAARVTVAALTRAGRPTRLPGDLRAWLAAHAVGG